VLKVPLNTNQSINHIVLYGCVCHPLINGYDDDDDDDDDDGFRTPTIVAKNNCYHHLRSKIIVRRLGYSFDR